MTVEKRPRFVHVISHGPGCLDGVTAAVVIARYSHNATVLPRFCSNTKINETLRTLRCAPGDADHEVWITDISWTDPGVDSALQSLLDAGVRVHWIDHHRTALERYRRGEVGVRFTAQILSERHAAARLVYEYLRNRLRSESREDERFEGLQQLVAMADDNDRWIHRLPGSRQLGLVVSLLGIRAYPELLSIDAEVTYTPAMREAHQQLEGELRRTFEVAERSRVARRLSPSDFQLVAAVCDGYPSEIADAWAGTSAKTIFALFDGRSLSVSLRRSPDCPVDLSQLARRLGGGGHAAAAGCELPALQQRIAEWVAEAVASQIGGTDPQRRGPGDAPTPEADIG